MSAESDKGSLTSFLLNFDPNSYMAPKETEKQVVF